MKTIIENSVNVDMKPINNNNWKKKNVENERVTKTMVIVNNENQTGVFNMGRSRWKVNVRQNEWKNMKKNE